MFLMKESVNQHNFFFVECPNGYHVKPDSPSVPRTCAKCPSNKFIVAAQSSSAETCSSSTGKLRKLIRMAQI